MSFARLHKWVSYLFAALGLIVLSIGPYLDVVSELVIGFAFVASFFVEGALIRDRRWILGWTLGLFGFLALQIVRGFTGASILPLALEFAAALQISRLFNRRGAREHQQIVALGLLQLLAATVLSTDLIYGFAFAGFVVTVPWVLALGHLRAEIEKSHPGPTAGEHDEEAVAKVLAQKRLIGPGFLAGTALLAIPLFLMTGVLFIAFPRVGLGMFSFGRSTGQQVSGFGANVELGDFGVIRSDPTVVLRVTPPQMSEDPPLLATILMRGTSFDHYDGRRWTRARDFESVGIGRVGTYYAIMDPPLFRAFTMPVDAEGWEVVLDPLEEPVIFLPPQTVGLSVPPRVVGGLDIGCEITVALGDDIRYADGDGLGLEYVAFTSPSPPRRAPILEPEVARRYLQVPEGHERVAALAREWTSGAHGAPEAIAQLLARLRDSGDYAYTLEMPRVGDAQPLDVFLFEARRGHCEYFSTAMAVMLRTLGIPSRNATGFLGGRYNAFGGYYALSQGDAHSWVEAWVDGRGWVTIDPTPSGRDLLHPDPGAFGALQELLDALRTRWANDIVSYDLSSQARIFWQVRRWMRGERDVSSETRDPEAASPGDASSGRIVPWKAIGAGVILLAIGWLIVWGLRRRREKRPPGDPNARRAVELIVSLEKVLAALGWARPPDRTPHEHAERLERDGFGEALLVREIVDRYLVTRYGGGTFEPRELDRLKRKIRALGGRRDLLAEVG